MRYPPEQLDRKIRTQALICMVNGWLLEHYERQRALLGDNKESPAADPSERGVGDGTTDKETSAHGCIIHE